jgi:hypothetical protein
MSSGLIHLCWLLSGDPFKAEQELELLYYGQTKQLINFHFHRNVTLFQN